MHYGQPGLLQPMNRLVNDSFALPDVPSYCEGMIEPQSDPMVSTEEEVEVDAETAAAIDRGIRAANEGRVISSEEVRKLIPQWISKFSTPNQR